MIAAYIVLSIVTLVLFVLAQDVYVRITYDEELRVSFNFVLLALSLSKEDKAKKKKKVKKKRLGREFYLLLIKHVSEYAEGCEVIVKRLSVPYISFSRGEIPLPRHDFGWSASLIIAYLDSKALKLTIENNGLTLIPDNRTVIDLAFKSTYFSMLYFMIRLWRDYRKTKRERELSDV